LGGQTPDPACASAGLHPAKGQRKSPWALVLTTVGVVHALDCVEGSCDSNDRLNYAVA
jgi:hypothetical protein